MKIIAKISSELNRLWQWFWSKRSEIAQMDYRDALMAQLVLEILQTSIKHEFRYVPLFNCKPIHPTDNRENTFQATQARVDVIQARKEELLQTRLLSKEIIAELMPSATYIRGIPYQEDHCFTIEGNGRVAALKQVFSPEDRIEIELDLYYPKKLERSQKKILKLRKMHGFKD